MRSPLTRNVAFALALLPVAIWAACSSSVEQPAAPQQDSGTNPSGDSGAPGSDTAIDESGLDAPTDDTLGTDANDLDVVDGFEDTYDPGTEYVTPDDCGVADGESDDADPHTGIPTGTRFCELYRDVMHHDGVGKCQSYVCHGGLDGKKGLSMGYTRDSCYKALTTHVAMHFPPPELLVRALVGKDSRPFSALMRYLSPYGTETEPYMPMVFDWLGNRKLTPEEQAKFNIWLARGAPND